MKHAVFAVLFALVAAASADAFTQWSVAHGKHYTAREHARRSAVFAANQARAQSLSAESGAAFGATQFADLTPEEFANTYLRTVPHPQESVVRRTGVKSVGDLPANWDWRQQSGVVGPVKNQASCGSCWAFSTVEYLESAAVLKLGLKNEALSPQQIVDCDTNCLDTPAPDGAPCDKGCDGGWPTTAIKYVVDNGIESEKDYPYKGRTMKCAYDATKPLVRFNGTATSLPIGDEASIQALLYAEGPLSISLDAMPWQLYFGGIYESEKCSKEWKDIDHSVLLVGWGHDEASGKDYWIVRNSWGASWGEQGHIRILKGKNICGIANMVVWLQ